MYARTHANVYTLSHLHTHTHTHVYTLSHVHSHAHTRTLTHNCVHTFAHTHVRTRGAGMPAGADQGEGGEGDNGRQGHTGAALAPLGTVVPLHEVTSAAAAAQHLAASGACKEVVTLLGLLEAVNRVGPVPVCAHVHVYMRGRLRENMSTSMWVEGLRE
jgi:hypothetical protein